MRKLIALLVMVLLLAPSITLAQRTKKRVQSKKPTAQKTKRSQKPVRKKRSHTKRVVRKQEVVRQSTSPCPKDPPLKVQVEFSYPDSGVIAMYVSVEKSALVYDPVEYITGTWRVYRFDRFGEGGWVEPSARWVLEQQFLNRFIEHIKPQRMIVSSDQFVFHQPAIGECSKILSVLAAGLQGYEIIKVAPKECWRVTGEQD